MHTKLYKMVVATAVGLGMAAASVGIVASPAGAAAQFETMPIWRLQVRITTGDTATAGTDGTPAVRLNLTSDGVRTLNPANNTAFDRQYVDTYDLRLVATPAAITMLRIGVAGPDDWCVKRVQLLINGRVAFDRYPSGTSSCRPIGPGIDVEYSSTDLRTNPKWVTYGTPPPLPTGVAAADLRSLVEDATGSAMTATPGLSWDAANPLRLTTKTSSSINVSFGTIYGDGVDLSRTINTYDLRFFTGADGKLHALKENASSNDHGMSDAVVSQLDTTLSRMTARPLPHDPLRFGVDAATDINWSYLPVVCCLPT